MEIRPPYFILSHHCTMFKNHPKCRISIFDFLYFAPIFVLSKLTCLATLFECLTINFAMLNETFSVIFKHSAFDIFWINFWPAYFHLIRLDFSGSKCLQKLSHDHINILRPHLKNNHLEKNSEIPAVVSRKSTASFPSSFQAIRSVKISHDDPWKMA